MKPIKRIESCTVALPTKDIDTDQIMPARFLTTTDRAGLVQLAVYNTSGKEVAVLLEQSMRAGEHFTTWDPQGFSNGVYFITLRSGGRVMTRRVVLAR